jgi:hypothetical protein
MSLLVRVAPARPWRHPFADCWPDLDPSLPILNAQTLEAHAAIGLFPQRIALWVAATLGGVALLLALIGIYGVTAYGVTQRTREIGIRIALGSSRGSVLGLVIGQGVRLGVIGIAFGIAAAMAATRCWRASCSGSPEPIPLPSARRPSCWSWRRCWRASSRHVGPRGWIRWSR